MTTSFASAGLRVMPVTQRLVDVHRSAAAVEDESRDVEACSLVVAVLEAEPDVEVAVHPEVGGEFPVADELVQVAAGERERPRVGLLGRCGCGVVVVEGMPSMEVDRARAVGKGRLPAMATIADQIGRASCRERV